MAAIGRAFFMPIVEAATSPLGKAFASGLSAASTAYACKDLSESVMGGLRGTRAWPDVGKSAGLTMASTMAGGVAGRMAGPAFSDAASVAAGLAFDTGVAHRDEISALFAGSRMATPQEEFVLPPVENPFTGGYDSRS